MSKIRFFVIVGGVVLGLGVVGIWFYATNSRSTSEALSARSTQFLAEHGSDVATKTVEFGDEDAYQPNRVYDAACFSLVMPFASQPAKIEEPNQDCILRLKTTGPISRVAVQTKPVTGLLADDPAITMRRQDTKTYLESHLDTNRYGQVLRFDHEQAVTVFWQTKTHRATIGFTGLTNPATVDDKRLVELLESFQINTTPEIIKHYESSETTTASDAAGF